MSLSCWIFRKKLSGNNFQLNSCGSCELHPIKLQLMVTWPKGQINWDLREVVGIKNLGWRLIQNCRAFGYICDRLMLLRFNIWKIHKIFDTNFDKIFDFDLTSWSNRRYFQTWLAQKLFHVDFVRISLKNYHFRSKITIDF